MERLIPVNAPSPVPRAPPAHREKRRRESESPEPEPAGDDSEDERHPADDADPTHTIDEYV